MSNVFIGGMCDAVATNGLPPYLVASTRAPTTAANPLPTCVPWRSLELAGIVAPHMGCICPAGANKDCENPTCPRKPRDYANMKAT